MHKKITCLILLSLLFGFNDSSFSQNKDSNTSYSIYQSEPFKKPRIFYEKYYKWKDHLYVVMKGLDEITIQKFDSKYNLIDQARFKKFFKLVGEKIEFIHQYDDHAVFFISKWDRKSKEDVLISKSISLEGLEISKSKELIRTKPLEKEKDRNKYQINAKYHFSIGDDNRLFVEYRFKDNKDLHIKVFDKNLTFIDGKLISFSYPNDRIHILDRIIDSSNNYFLLVLIGSDISNMNKDDGVNYKIELFRVGKDVESLTKRSINHEDKIIDEIAFAKFENGGIALYGTVRNQDNSKGVLIGKKKGQPTGIFTAQLDDNIDFKNFMIHGFPKEMIVGNMSKRKQKDYNKEYDPNNDNTYFPYLKLKGLTSIKADNSNIILGEEFHGGPGIKPDGRKYEDYYLNNILVAKIQSRGKLDWMKKLTKFQKGGIGYPDLSFVQTQLNNKLYLLFMDNDKNLGKSDKDIEHSYISGKEGHLMAYVINTKTGELSKDLIFDTAGLEGLYFAFRSSNNELIYKAHDKKGVRFVKIRIE